MEVQFPEIKTILLELADIKRQVQENQNTLTQQWYNDEQCWKLKGGMALSTYRTNRYYQVKGGIPEAYVGGRKVWSRASVEEWLPLTDDELEEYHRKYKTGAKRK